MLLLYLFHMVLEVALRPFMYRQMRLLFIKFIRRAVMGCPREL